MSVALLRFLIKCFLPIFRISVLFLAFSCCSWQDIYLKGGTEMKDYIDLLIEQKWREVSSAFHNFFHSYGIQIGVAIFCVLVYWFIRRITKKQKHA